MKKGIIFVFVLLLMAVLAPGALAAPSFDTVIEENEVINNDVVVLEGDLEIKTGAVVNGDVTVFNGDAFVDGLINGSLTLFNGDLEAGEAAVITGECVLLNGNAEYSEGGDLRCTSVENFKLPEIVPPVAPNWLKIDPLPPIPPLQANPTAPQAPTQPVSPSGASGFWGTLGRIGGVFGSSLLMGLLALVVGAAMPSHLQQVQTTIREKPVASGGVGLLTMVAVPSLIVLLVPLSIILTFVCIGLLGFPIMILLAVGLVLGALLGWIAVGYWLGQRLLRPGKSGRRVAPAAALGTFLVTMGVGMFGVVSFAFGGTLLALIILWMGLGAVVLTQFGAKPYPRLPQSGPTDSGEGDEKVQTVLRTLPAEEAATIVVEN